MNAHGKGNLTGLDGVESFYRYAAATADAILIALDADNDCPLVLGRALAQRVALMGGGKPCAIVVARRQFESWLLSDLGSIAGQVVRGRVLIPAGTAFVADPEIVNAKQWLVQHSAPQTTYKETSDQVALAARIDLSAAATGSRSFRRLLTAVRHLVDSYERALPSVSPG
jgi:hypothetical protein